MSDAREIIARAIAPIAWAALGAGDTLANSSRRTASMRHAEKAMKALDVAGFVILPKNSIGQLTPVMAASSDGRVWLDGIEIMPKIRPDDA